MPSYWFSMKNNRYDKTLFSGDFLNASWIRPGIDQRFRGEANTVHDTFCSDCGDKNCHWFSDSKAQNYPDPEITYALNNYVYRCDDFSKEDATHNFLFSGCSQTQGTGLPYESTWAFQFNKRMGKTKFFSLACAGIGYEQIINDVYTYIDKFGKPEAIFLLMPNLERDIIFIPYKGGNYLCWDHWDAGAGNEDKRKMFQPDILCFKFYRQMLNLERYCNQLGIPLMWSTWHQNLDVAITDHMEFNNYFSFYSKKSGEITAMSNTAQHREGWTEKYWKKARDMHGGASRQYAWSNLFEYHWKERNSEEPYTAY